MTHRRVAGAALVLGALVMAIVPMSPGWVEQRYSIRVYAWLQPLVTSLSDLVPWALLDVWLILGAGGAVLATFRWWMTHRSLTRGRGTHWGGLAWTMAVVVATAYVAFCCLWGLNYRRDVIEYRVAFSQTRVTADRILVLAKTATGALNDLHGRAHARPWPELDELPAQFGPAFVGVAERLGLGWRPRPGRPKHTFLAPYFRWAAIAGLTNPFGLEVLPSPDGLPFERHAIMAHEWAHLAGFAREDEANVVAWLTCAAADAQAAYSGWLAVWPSLAGAVPADQRNAVTASLGAGPRGDLQAAAARNARALPAVRRVAWGGYDAYLRSQRVPEGVASYQGVVRLIAGLDPAGPFLPSSSRP